MAIGAFDLSISIQAIDKASANLRQIERNAGIMSKNMQRHFKTTADSLDKIGKTSLLAGAALTGVSALNAKSAIDFEKSMANVSTLVDTNVESMDDMQKSVLGISKRTPVALGDLTEALYNVRSAGIDASSSMSVLEKSAQLGVAGLGSTNEAVDLVTSSINAWELKGKDAGKIYDTVFKAVKFGKTNISGLAQGFGAVVGTVAAAKIETDEYFASVSALTTVGQPASQAHTQIKAAIAGLTRNTKEQQKIFRQLGAKDFTDLIQKSGGMVGAFEGITRSIGGNKAKLIELLGSVEAYNAVLGLTGKQNAAFKATISSMRTGTDLFAEGFAKQTKTAAAQLQILQNTFQAIGITLGSALLPPLNKGVKFVKGLADAFDALPDPVKSFISVSTLAAGVSLVSFGAIAMSTATVMRALSDTKMAFSGFAAVAPRVSSAVLGMSRAFAVFGASLMTTPIGAVVVGVALIAGAAILIRKCWTPITQFFKGMWSGIIKEFKPVIDEFKNFLKPLAPIGNAIKSWIQPVNTAGAKSHQLGTAIGMTIGQFMRGAITVVKFFLKFSPLGWVIRGAVGLAKNWDKICSVFERATNKAGRFFALFGGKKDIKVAADVKSSVASASIPAAQSKGAIKRFAVGSEGITKTGLAIVDEGEMIIPKSVVNAGGSSSFVFAPQISVSGAVSDADKIKTMLKQLFYECMAEYQRRQGRLAF